MASQENLVKMVNKATGYTYMTRKNRKKLAGVKLKLKKYDWTTGNKHIYMANKIAFNYFSR